jgi:tetratricopeptide (TPR) repeat protein
MAICREIGDRLGESRTLNNLGALVGLQGAYAGAQDYFCQSLVITQEIGDRNGECLVLRNLGEAARFQGNYARAREYYEQSLALAREVDSQDREGHALIGLGDVLVELGNLAEALAFLQESIALWRELGNQALQMEARATLARVHLASENIDQAMAQIEQILAYLDAGGSFVGAEQPLRNDLTCYQVLQAANDPRAAGVLHAAYDQLREQAARIPDAPTRRVFLENISWHREIVQLWRAAHQHEEQE